MWVIGWTTRLEGKRSRVNGLWCPENWVQGRWPDDLALARRFKTRQLAEWYIESQVLIGACTVVHLDEAPLLLALSAL